MNSRSAFGLVLAALSCGGPAGPTTIAQSDLSTKPQKQHGEWTYNIPLCGGDPAATSFGIQSPIPPRLYKIPKNAVPVGNAVDLFNEVRNGVPRAVVVGPGTYEAPQGFDFLQFGAADRLYAEVPGRTVFRFGIAIGSNNPSVPDLHAGVELHGLILDIDDAAHAAAAGGGTNAAILAYGDARDLLIQDCWLNGRRVVERGIYSTQEDGLVIERVEVLDFLRFGVQVATTVDSPFDPTLEARPVIRDAVVIGIYDDNWPPSVAQAGQQEIGIFTYVSAELDRIQVRRSGAANIATGHNDLAVNDVQMRHIDVDTAGDTFSPGVGIYFEQGNKNGSVERFCVGNKTSRGVSVEWAHPSTCTTPAGPGQACPPNPNEHNAFRCGFTDSKDVGVAVDAYSVDTRLARLLVRKAGWAGLVLNDNLGFGTDTTACGLAIQLPPTVCEAYYGPYGPTGPPPGPRTCDPVPPCS